MGLVFERGLAKCRLIKPFRYLHKALSADVSETAAKSATVVAEQTTCLGCLNRAKMIKNNGENWAVKRALFMAAYSNPFCLL